MWLDAAARSSPDRRKGMADHGGGGGRDSGGGGVD
jgi:hypothetical protein